jgi:EAL domain-containing protein (putative c-di-GMP-specific phosphodiesterase class I)
MLKIDRSFVNVLTSSGTGRTLAQTIISLGKAFNMTTVAEGVETPEQFETLAHLGCDQSQGYLHSRPLSVADIEPMLKNGLLPASTNGARHNGSNKEQTSLARQG